jgi:transcriptional regulator with XRE-family HTH domain
MKFKLNDYSRGEVMKILREWTELTQHEFGKRIGKSKPSVQDYELGKTNYGIDVLNKIADEFGFIITVEKK